MGDRVVAPSPRPAVGRGRRWFRVVLRRFPYRLPGGSRFPGLGNPGVSEQATDLVALPLTKAFFGPQDYAIVATRP